jgi:diguanylate cyclase (GGDEF)-like protein
VWGRPKQPIDFLKKIPLKKAGWLVLFAVIFLPFPIFLTFSFQPHPLRTLFFFYLADIFLAFLLLKKYTQKNRDLKLQREALQEKINLQNFENAKELQNQKSLQEKIRRYSCLRQVIEGINASLTLESIAEELSSQVFSLIASGRGTCSLYLIDKLSHNLALLKTKKEDKKTVIRTKQGDIFDHWVLRHASPLLIEDIKKDFRFDLEKLKEVDLRPFSCLISSPLVSGSQFIGVLRLDYPKANFYTQDDLRFLLTICDLGAVALENGELYQDTQELAIRDGLTSLFTRGHFMELLKLECKRSLRKGGIFSLLMLDIDYFKNYNDKLGHTAGDIVLQVLSSSISEFFKGRDALISRFGGEEFCLILPEVDKKEAYAAADSLRAHIEKNKIILRRQESGVTVSIGVASFPKDASDEVELIMKADKAMYQAKEKGRNYVVGA